jgi:glycosyltransferase involved in cell wall biosynthesis
MNVEEQIAYSIVVPLYDEQENVSSLYVKITEVMDQLGEPYEMVFVDDGSTDNTYKVLLDIYEHDRRVNLIRLRRNFGQTAALKAAFDYAQGEIVISLDGDLQNDPAEIPQFLEKIKEGYDLVSGWRVRRTEPWLTRRLPSRAANWLMAWLSGVPLHDFGNTFKAYRREILPEIRLYGELHRFIPALASWSGARIAELPIRHASRKNGKSKYGLGRSIRVLLDLISVKFLLDYSTRPLQFFGLYGLLGLSAGLLISFVLLGKKVFQHQAIMLQHGPLMLLGITLILSGIQLISLGLLGEILSRTYYETQHKPIYAVREFKSRRAVTASATEHDPGSRRP